VTQNLYYIAINAASRKCP